jgi:CMP-N-acetylneuraminic acid synthetase
MIIPNGPFYIREVADFLSSGKILGDETFGFMMSEESSIDIDIEIDLATAEVLLKKTSH